MNHKHILAFILVILFAFSLFACGESTYADPGESTSAPGEETESESIPEQPKTAFKRVKRAIHKNGDTTETLDFVWEENRCMFTVGNKDAEALYDPKERLFSFKYEGRTTPFIKYDENGMILIMYAGDEEWWKVTGYDENNMPILSEDGASAPFNKKPIDKYDPETRTVTMDGGGGGATRDDGTKYSASYENEYVLGEFGNIITMFHVIYEKSGGDEKHYKFVERKQLGEAEYDSGGNVIRFTYDSDIYEFEYSDEAIHEPWERLAPFLQIDVETYIGLPWFWQLKG